MYDLTLVTSSGFYDEGVKIVSRRECLMYQCSRRRQTLGLQHLTSGSTINFFQPVPEFIKILRGDPMSHGEFGVVAVDIKSF